MLIAKFYGINICQMQDIKKDTIFLTTILLIITYVDYYVIPLNLIICCCSGRKESSEFHFQYAI